MNPPSESAESNEARQAETGEATTASSPSQTDEAAVRGQLGAVEDFVRSLSGDDIRSGNWFEKLLAHSLHAYTTKVDAEYFRAKYPGLPADAIVEARIAMAARYAAIEGGLSASAYTGAVVATLGTLGGASPATVPAAVVTVLVDVAFVSRLQIQLAYDIAVLYRVTIDPSDPEDLWKLIRVAFTIKTGEFAREGVAKAVPVLVRPLIKAFYRGDVLQAARALPVVGKYLLQKTVLKVGIPAVGVPLAIIINRYTTVLAGRHARTVFRKEARAREEANRILRLVEPDEALIWVVWAAVMADGKISDAEKLLMRDLVAGVRVRSGRTDVAFDELIEVDLDEVWQRVEASATPADILLAIARRTAEIDGPTNKKEAAFLDTFASRFATTST